MSKTVIPVRKVKVQQGQRDTGQGGAQVQN